MIFSLLLRIILFCTLLYIPVASAKLDVITDIIKKSNTEKEIFLKDINQKMSYSLGVSLGNYINQVFKEQNKIGVKLHKNILFLGVKDVLFGKLKMSKKEIITILHILENKLKHAQKNYLENESKKNAMEGKVYMNNFSKQKGVKKTDSGLLYLVEKTGEGEKIQDTSKVVVHYTGSFINGVEFDSSYARGEPISISLEDVIEGWKEGLRYINKGGKIKLVIPPHLAYGNKRINGIPANSTIIFEIELLDVINDIVS